MPVTKANWPQFSLDKTKKTLCLLNTGKGRAKQKCFIALPKQKVPIRQWLVVTNCSTLYLPISGARETVSSSL